MLSSGTLQEPSILQKFTDFSEKLIPTAGRALRYRIEDSTSSDDTILHVEGLPSPWLCVALLEYGGYFRYRGSFPAVKRPGPEFDHSPPSRAEVKNEWTCTSTPLICLPSADRAKFIIMLNIQNFYVQLHSVFKRFYRYRNKTG
jgi:hypothetical protein